MERNNIKKGQQTLTSPDPTKILAKYPSSVASKETVALSVSTSQNEVPGSNLSPSLMFHLEMDPVSIVCTTNQMEKTNNADDIPGKEKAL